VRAPDQSRWDPGSVSAQTLDERYGARSPQRRRLVVGVSVVVAVAFLGWLAWVIYEQTTPQVTSDLETWSIKDEHEATAVMVVHLHDSGVKASCTLRAYAEDHTVVGELSFTPKPTTARQTVSIRTERKATSVEPVGCTAPGQERPR
jgi:hypothetical protein